MRAKVVKVTEDQADYPMVPVPSIFCSAVQAAAAATEVSPEVEAEQWKS